MRVVLTIHDFLDRNSGSPGSTIALAEAYHRAGHDIELISFEDLPARIGRPARMLAFPGLVAARMAGSLGRWCDAIDSAAGDAWLVPRHGRAGPALAVRAHGLEHGYEERARTPVDRRVTIRHRYSAYHGRERLREVAATLRRSDVAFFLNDDDLDYAVARLGVDRSRSHLVWNGIDDSLLGQPPPAQPEAGAPLRLALIARHTERMGAAYYIPALERILMRHPACSVTLLGCAAPADAVLRDFAAPVRHRISAVPSYDRDSLPELLGGHEILVSAKFAEGFGKGLVEGMACGLAPVTAAAPGPKTILEHEETGLLVPPRDNEAWVAAVERLIESPILRLRLRQNAHAAAQRFSWDSTAAERLALLERAVAARSGPPVQRPRSAARVVARPPARRANDPGAGREQAA